MSTSRSPRSTGWTRVGSVAPLVGLSQLVALDISATSVRDFTALKGMAALRGLKVSGLRDLGVLAALKELESLGHEPADAGTAFVAHGARDARSARRVRARSAAAPAARTSEDARPLPRGAL